MGAREMPGTWFDWLITGFDRPVLSMSAVSFDKLRTNG